MCNPKCLDFVGRSLDAADVTGRRVLEVGAYDVNGSPRSIIEAMGPSAYVGVDIVEGPGVDVICDAEALLERFGPESFDVIVSTEMIEHVANWQRIVSNFKRVLTPGGVLVATTRSRGFPLHDYPADHWRFETEDMRVIFADCVIEAVERDAPADPGVFVKARKPVDFEELDLSGYALYSMISDARALSSEEAARHLAVEEQRVLLTHEVARRHEEAEAADAALSLARADADAGVASLSLARADAEALRTQLTALEQLRTFRYTARLRHLYGRARSVLRAGGGE